MVIPGNQIFFSSYIGSSFLKKVNRKGHFYDEKSTVKMKCWRAVKKSKKEKRKKLFRLQIFMYLFFFLMLP